MQQQTVVKDLVLIGGGHAHVSVLRRFGMKPLPGVRLTLVTRDVHTPYSGMLPGFVAGHYDYDACHIDLAPLAQFAGARLYHAAVEGIDLAGRLVYAHGRPPVAYDVLSINVGSRPQTLGIPGAADLAMPVKPIDVWLQRWEEVQQRVLASHGEFHLVVVGGGAGGVEITLATQHRLRVLLAARGDDPARLSFTLISSADEVLATHNAGVRRRFARVLKERGVSVINGKAVTGVQVDSVGLDDGSRRAADVVLWLTDASAPGWPEAAGLTVDGRGFIAVNEYLQSTSHPEVFAAGDIASLPDPRPKSGVFAVRQGPALAHNLRQALTGRALRRYRPQRNFLGLISTGDRYAVASRGGWSAEGRWLWTLKDWIDRRFMSRFNELPAMAVDAGPAVADGLADRAAMDQLATLAMRCGGCGAKVGSPVLTRVMQRLPQEPAEGLLLGLDAPDDAAVLAVPEGQVLVQSVDYFRAFIDDPYVFGRIAANHALGDVFAMGARPHSALAIATVPYGLERVVELTLYELMSGALEILQQAGAALAGGHSSEGAELAFGLSVNGFGVSEQLLRKGGLRPGDALLLTKPVGTGTLLAAAMRGRAKGRWVDGALGAMQQSSGAAADCLRAHGATACTDLTGFGLAGHLVEMGSASAVDIRLEMDRVPLLDGALETVAAGILSSLQPQNLRLRRAVRNVEDAAGNSRYPLMFDPQTAGGLLAGVPPDQVAACIDRLHQLGYTETAVIGTVVERREATAMLDLV